MKYKFEFTPARLAFMAQPNPEKREIPAGTTEAEPLTKERIDEYEKKVTIVAESVQKDVNDIAKYFKLVPPTIDINSVKFDENGKCIDSGLIARLDSKIRDSVLKERVLTRIGSLQAMRKAIENAREGKIKTDAALQEVLGSSRDKIIKAAQIESLDPLAGLEPTMRTLSVTFSDVSEVIQQRKEAKEKRTLVESEEKEAKAHERETQMQLRNNPEQAPKTVIEDILRKDVMAGINYKQNARAREDLHLSEEMIGYLKRYCVATSTGTAMDVDLVKMGARTFDGELVSPQPGPTRIEIIPSKDARFVQFNWTVRMASKAGGDVEHVNTLNIVLDASAYSIDRSKPEGQQLVFKEPNLKAGPVNPELEEQKGYEKQYDSFIAEIKDAAPGARISMIQKTMRYFPEEGVSKEILTKVLVKKWHNIDGRADQYAIYRGEQVGDGEWKKIGGREMVGFNNIRHLTDLPHFVKGGRVEELTRPPEKVADRIAGIKRSYDLALEEVVSLGQAMQIKTFHLTPELQAKYEKAVDQVFTMLDNYGIPEGMETRLADAGFKLQKVTDAEGTKTTIDYLDVAKNEKRSTDILTEKATV